MIQGIDKGLDVTGLLFVGNQDAVRACRNYNIFQTHTEYGKIQLVDYVHISAGFVKQCFADIVAVHGLSQSIPGSKVFPHAGETHHFDTVLVFYHCVIKTDFV